MREKWEDFLQTIPPPPLPPGEVEAPSEEMEEIEEIVVSDVSRGNTPKNAFTKARIRGRRPKP